MTTPFTFSASVDSNGAFTIPWEQSKLDAFGQFPGLIVTINRQPTQNYGFNSDMPLVNPCNLVLYGLNDGDKITVLAIKG